jgi:uncharacterized protein YfiM (DUF2279 family)
MDELVRLALILALGGAPVPPSLVSVDAVEAVDAAGLEQPDGGFGSHRNVAGVEAISVPGLSSLQQPARVTDAWLGSDKFRHFWMSYATTAFSFAAARAAGQDTDAALWVAVPVAGAAGVGKEIFDLRSGGIFSVRDLVADALGVAAGYFLLREVR